MHILTANNLLLIHTLYSIAQPRPPSESPNGDLAICVLRRTLMKQLIYLVAILIAITITTQTAQASSHGLTWSYKNYATSEYLKMPPAYVLRTEHGYIVVPTAIAAANSPYKTMGEGEAPTRKVMPLSPPRPNMPIYHWHTQEL